MTVYAISPASSWPLVFECPAKAAEYLSRYGGREIDRSQIDPDLLADLPEHDDSHRDCTRLVCVKPQPGTYEFEVPTLRS